MKKPAKASIEVRGTVVNIVTQNEADYICLTDIARLRNPEANLGAGGGAVKPFIGFASGDEPEISPDDAIAQRAVEAIRKPLRPELVNRLTKVVHFKPLGMETAREILGKLMRELNERLEGVVVRGREDDSDGETPPERLGALNRQIHFHKSSPP